MTIRKSPTGERRAFTLLELLVVLTLMGLLTALAVPAYAKLAPRLRVFATRQQLLTDLRHAHNQAIATRKNVDIAFHPARYELDGLTRRPSVNVTVTTPAAAGDPAPETSRLRFFADGSATPAVLSLSEGGLRAQLTIDALTGEALANDD
jgi:prepilin-type N-terminal cleavage/methylation domain-containing protein